MLCYVHNMWRSSLYTAGGLVRQLGAVHMTQDKLEL
jgi:hypothetical protein